MVVKELLAKLCLMLLCLNITDSVNGKTQRRYPVLPCRVVNTTGAGDALMAGIIHAGSQATIDEAARVGLLCAKNNIESPDTVNQQQVTRNR